MWGKHLIIDMTAATGQGAVLMKPKTQFGWPARVAFRVKPGSFEKLRRERGQDAQYKETHLLPAAATACEMDVVASF